jgi:hypothetical protein
MEEVVDQVMRTYGLMVNLTPEEEQTARERLSEFLKDKHESARQLSVEGVSFFASSTIAHAARFAFILGLMTNPELSNLSRYRVGLRNHPEKLGIKKSAVTAVPVCGGCAGQPGKIDYRLGFNPQVPCIKTLIERFPRISFQKIDKYRHGVRFSKLSLPHMSQC